MDELKFLQNTRYSTETPIEHKKSRNRDLEVSKFNVWTRAIQDDFWDGLLPIRRLWKTNNNFDLKI